MPRGAKKRKAARRKQQMPEAPAAGAPLHRAQDNGHGHHDDGVPLGDAKEGGDGGCPMSSASSSAASSPRVDHSSRSDEELLGPGSAAIDSTTESDKGDESPVVVEEVAFAKSEESVTGFAKSVEEVRVEKIVSLPEEGKQVCAAAAAAEVFEETSDEVLQVQAGAPLSEAQPTAVEQLGESREDRCVAGKSEASIVVAEVAPPSPPLILRRSSWWTCCGLIELFTGSGR